MTHLQGRGLRLEQALIRAFGPTELVIEDESARHAHHAGAQAGGETHYAVRIVSAAFEGLSRVERSRRVHEVLAPEFASGLHALSLVARTPDEAGPRG
jgi:BolA protein